MIIVLENCLWTISEEAYLRFLPTERYDHMAHTIATKVAEMIRESGSERVETEVVSVMVEREIEKRAQAAVQGLDKLAKMENDYKKIDRPDVIMLDAEGKETSAAYSPARIKERKEAREKIGKLERSLKKALEDGDFSDLYQQVAGGGNQPDKQDKSKGEGEAG